MKAIFRAWSHVRRRRRSDLALGIPGTLLLVNTSFQNLGFVEVEGIDAAFEYVMPSTTVGTFTLRLDGAYIGSFKQQGSAGEPMRELADTFARPEFRGRAQLGWRLGGFEAITTFNYIDSYEDITVDRRVDYDTTVDLLLEYRFQRTSPGAATEVADKKTVARRMDSASNRHAWLAGMAVRAGVRNIFDDAPPFSNSTAGYPVPLNDPRQRFFFVDIEKRF